MKYISRITGKEYTPDEVLYINYAPQYTAYLANGAETEVIDVFYDTRKCSKNKLVFVFPRNEKMKELYELWKQQKLDF